MVMEWVPSMTQLAPLPTRADGMNEAQQARLHSALRLLDLDCSGSFDRGELREALPNAHVAPVTNVKVQLKEDGHLNVEFR